MGLEGGPRAVYRLVVGLDDRDVVYDAPLFKHYKQARAQVAAAICQQARDGTVRNVTLQQGTLRRRNGSAMICLTPAARRITDELHWRSLARWESEVVQRILRQNGLSVPTAAPLPYFDTTGAPPASPLCNNRSPVRPKRRSIIRIPAVQRPARSFHQRARWQLLGTAVVLAVAWLVITLLQTGGHPLRWLRPTTPTPEPTIATELPFAAPATADRQEPPLTANVPRQEVSKP